MKIGKLDRRIRIEQRSTTQNTVDGSAVDTWSTVATVWGEVQEILPSKGESQSQGINIAERPARVRIRYRTDLTAAMRIVDLSRSNRVMRIIAQPVELGRKEGLEFIAADFTTSGNAA